jgi:hypothetical protein
LKRILFILALLISGAFSSTSHAQQVACPYRASYSVTGAGELQIVAAPTGTESSVNGVGGTTQAVQVCSLVIVADDGSSAGTISVDTGTGSNCGTGTAHVISPMPADASQGFNFLWNVPTAGMLTAPPGSAVCVNFSVAPTSGSVTVLYGLQ